MAYSERIPSDLRIRKIYEKGNARETEEGESSLCAILFLSPAIAIYMEAYVRNISIADTFYRFPYYSTILRDL